jgi:hypothetical protein
MREVTLRIDGVGLDFTLAEALARQVASKVEGEAMLLAWFDRKAGRECPEVKECMHKPGWLAYATGHGADLGVVVNEGEYVFLFCSVAAEAERPAGGADRGPLTGAQP